MTTNKMFTTLLPSALKSVSSLSAKIGQEPEYGFRIALFVVLSLDVCSSLQLFMRFERSFFEVDLSQLRLA
ncbi:MAG: hypothetical protein ACM37W_02245 [Actinomycetota bacterium]